MVSSATAGKCLANNVLRLILLPTEACNFRCSYCFEGVGHGRMEAAVVDGVKKLLERRAAGLDQLTLSWFGGEPLLALDLIEDVLHHARELRHEHPRMRFRSDITTNGYLLTRSTFKRLLELGVVEYQIALDGEREHHDRRRVQANGRPTFDRIWENLESVRELSGDFTVIVRLHVDLETQASAPAFIDRYRQSFGRDRRFRLFIRPLSRLGRPGSGGPPLLDPSAGQEIVRNLRQLAASKGIEQFGLEKVGAICYASRANSYVVRADGRLNKCSLDLEDPPNQVGRIRSDGTLEIDRSKLWGWLRGVWTNDEEALRCPRRGLRAEGRAVSWPAPIAASEVPLARRAQASAGEEDSS